MNKSQKTNEEGGGVLKFYKQGHETVVDLFEIGLIKHVQSFKFIT